MFSLLPGEHTFFNSFLLSFFSIVSWKKLWCPDHQMRACASVWYLTCWPLTTAGPRANCREPLFCRHHGNPMGSKPCLYQSISAKIYRLTHQGNNTIDKRNLISSVVRKAGVITFWKGPGFLLFYLTAPCGKENWQNISSGFYPDCTSPFIRPPG